MIIFGADDHFGAHPGAEIFKNISPNFSGMEFLRKSRVRRVKNEISTKESQ